MKQRSALIILASLILFFSSCVSSSYDTLSSRQSAFNKTEMVISSTGLSADMVSGILATKFPPASPVSIAIIFLNKNSPYKNDLTFHIMKSAGNHRLIEKLVPIPSIMVPTQITFEAIQQTGIRSLCEYTLLFYSNTNTEMTFTQFIKGEFTFISDMEFALIDNRTTALIASDRLYSTTVKKSQFMNDEILAKAKEEVFSEQAMLLEGKIKKLFGE